MLAPKSMVSPAASGTEGKREQESRTTTTQVLTKRTKAC